MFQYLSSRAAFAVITSLVISMIFGKRIIDMLRHKQIGESDSAVRGLPSIHQRVRTDRERRHCNLHGWRHWKGGKKFNMGNAAGRFRAKGSGIGPIQICEKQLGRTV